MQSSPGEFIVDDDASAGVVFEGKTHVGLWVPKQGEPVFLSEIAVHPGGMCGATLVGRQLSIFSGGANGGAGDVEALVFVFP